MPYDEKHPGFTEIQLTYGARHYAMRISDNEFLQSIDIALKERITSHVYAAMRAFHADADGEYARISAFRQTFFDMAMRHPDLSIEIYEGLHKAETGDIRT